MGPIPARGTRALSARVLCLTLVAGLLPAGLLATADSSSQAICTRMYLVGVKKKLHDLVHVPVRVHYMYTTTLPRYAYPYPNTDLVLTYLLLAILLNSLSLLLVHVQCTYLYM